jgi:ribonuclease HI
MEIEAAIPPIHIQFDRITKFYGVRVLKLQPSHPVRALIKPPRQRQEPTYVETKNLKASKKANKNRTQLENIMRSVGANKGYYKLERFKFARDLPWKPTIDQLPGVSIQISEQAKEKTAKLHEKWLEANESAIENLIYYTDASKRNCDGKTGAAICRINGKNTKDWSWFLGSCMEVFDAELFAIREAVYQLREFLATYHERGNCPIRKVFIFSDSQSGLKRIHNLTTRPGQSLIQKLTNDLLWITNKFQITVQFEWVPGHSGIRGNEIVD